MLKAAIWLGIAGAAVGIGCYQGTPNAQTLSPCLTSANNNGTTVEVAINCCGRAVDGECWHLLSFQPDGARAGWAQVRA